MRTPKQSDVTGSRRGTTARLLVRDFSRNRAIYLMAVPVLAYYVLFHYGPMYGAVIAFKDFSPLKGILGSDWVGFVHFRSFFGSYYFLRVVRNTLLISFYNLLFGFPAPILLAILLNEIGCRTFKRAVQTVTYLPHFVSVIVICGIIIDFTGRRGLVNDVIAALGGRRANLLENPGLFRPIYVVSDIWQHLGWDSIIYLAAISAIDPELYEAATIDGAGRWAKMRNVTLPGIMPTVVILLILQLGKMMNVGFEKIILLYNGLTYETADVISSFVYRRGLLEMSYSYSAAVGLFNSAINFVLLILANTLSRRVNETSLW